MFLLEYEQAHPEDITGDSCAICGGGEDVADDWISCDVSAELATCLLAFIRRSEPWRHCSIKGL